MLFDAIDLGATFVFAISGATQAVRHRLDLFGVLVVAWASAVAGGLARDLLIGAVPPAAIADWRYLAAAPTVRCRWPLAVCRHRHRQGVGTWARAGDGGHPGHDHLYRRGRRA
jgi:uncharacterized membrane protein YeiH